MYAEFTLKAQNEKVGIFRYYHIALMLNLFKEYTLIIAHGKIGHKARQRSIFFTNSKDLGKSLRQTLNKRLKAESRIGCNYELIDQNYDQEFKEILSPYLTKHENDDFLGDLDKRAHALG